MGEMMRNMDGVREEGRDGGNVLLMARERREKRMCEGCGEWVGEKDVWRGCDLVCRYQQKIIKICFIYFVLFALFYLLCLF